MRKGFLENLGLWLGLEDEVGFVWSQAEHPRQGKWCAGKFQDWITELYSRESSESSDL